MRCYKEGIIDGWVVSTVFFARVCVFVMCTFFFVVVIVVCLLICLILCFIYQSICHSFTNLSFYLPINLSFDSFISIIDSFSL